MDSLSRPPPPPPPPRTLPLQPRQVGGLFWNYLSVGLDAEAAYGFHTMRETHSWAASSRVLNQVGALTLGCAPPQGRFLGRMRCTQPCKALGTHPSHLTPSP